MKNLRRLGVFTILVALLSALSCREHPNTGNGYVQDGCLA
jgi:hypothetical protein